MSIYQLRSQNFNVSGFQKKTLNINVPGTVLVFFKMENCPGCAAFEPVFHELSQVEQSINYGIINITNFRDVAGMSRQTTTPIMKVPFILLYIEGKPIAIFKGKKNVPAMRSFIFKAIEQHGSQESYSTQQSSFVPEQQSRGGGGMYGSGGYSHPQIAPGHHAGYNRQQAIAHSQREEGKNYYQPDIDKTPNMRGALKGSQSQYAHLNDIEEEDDNKLQTPAQVTPHNVPWESSYKKIGTVD